jgi:UDP-N-acetylglucosamine--N-acetylmuramyl-(pentapeptide) pyrophosphoryl-undecaprenol N-acetylglucosamine transferase
MTSKPPPNDRPAVHLACSRGGHFDLLLNVQDAFAGCRVVWITQRSDRADALRRSGAEVHSLGEYHRGKVSGGLSAFRRSLQLVLRHRPRLVVTSGAGIVVPYCLLARLVGAKVVFVETSARVRGASSSGRVLSRIATSVVAQWEEMRTVYPRATIVRSSVVRSLAEEPATVGAGTFVGVGTHSQPFDRILALVDRALQLGLLPQPALAQIGPAAYEMCHADAREFLTADEMESAIQAARYVVCHAGTGSISTALRAGRRPLVLPRLERYGEHFDDHQQQIVDKLGSLDLVVPLNDEIVTAHLERADRPLRLPTELEHLPPLVAILRERVEETLHEPAPTPRP